MTDSALASSEYLDMDLTARAVRKYDASGGSVTAYAQKIAGTSWFAIHRSAASPATDAWPTIELDGGSGVFYYVRAWAN
jgi:hypothetical protein